MYDTALDVGVLILRVVLGLTMAAHGYNKFFGKGGLIGMLCGREAVHD